MFASLRTTGPALIAFMLCALGFGFMVAALILWGNIEDGVLGMLIWDALIVVTMRHKLSLTRVIVPEDDSHREQVAQVMHLDNHRRPS